MGGGGAQLPEQGAEPARRRAALAALGAPSPCLDSTRPVTQRPRLECGVSSRCLIFQRLRGRLCVRGAAKARAAAAERREVGARCL